MKLQARVSRIYKGKEYLKYTVTIPPKIVKELGLRKNQELEPEIRAGNIVLIP